MALIANVKCSWSQTTSVTSTTACIDILHAHACVFCVWRFAHHDMHTSPAIAVMCVLHTRNSHVHTVKMLYPGCLLASVGLVGQRSKLGTTCMTSLVFDSLSLWMYAAQFLWEPRQHTKCTCCLHKICGCMGESILRPGRILTWLGTRKKSTRAHADIISTEGSRRQCGVTHPWSECGYAPAEMIRHVTLAAALSRVLFTE